jgi:Methyltransferase small domain.
MLEYRYRRTMSYQHRQMMHSWFQSVRDPRFALISNAFQRVGFSSGAYARIRMALCPLFDIEAALPEEGTIVDVGCGAGLLLQWLALDPKNDRRRLIGIETDCRRVALGRQVCDSLAINCRVDLRIENFGNANVQKNLAAIVFVDVLHHMDFDLQETMILHAFELLAEGGTLVIKDVGTTPAVKYLYSYLFDALTKVTRITQGKIGYYRSQSGWVSLLFECGFQPSIARVRHIDFAPHILITGKKPRNFNGKAL